MKFYLYETAADLAPLDMLRAQCDILVGARTIRERAAALFRAEPLLIPRERPAPLPGEPAPVPPFAAGLFAPANLVPRSAVPLDGPEEAGVDGERIVFMRLGASRAAAFDPARPEASAEGLPRRPMNALFVDRPWDIVRHLPVLLRDDAESLARVKPSAPAPPHVVLDSSSGPVHIDATAVVEPFTYLVGPCVIGPRVLVKSHSSIRTSAVNEGCRVGGEISSALFFPFSNKQHHGFLGHSVVASWVNIGAGATGSNLKNTYGEIRIDGAGTGLNYLGQIVGDHTKIGIQAVMNTGSIYGICSQIVCGGPTGAAGVLPKMIPSFDFSGIPADVEAVLKTARIAMARRNRQLEPAQEKLIRAWAARFAR